MVSAPDNAVAKPVADAPPATGDGAIAHLNARISAYLVDSVVLLAFILIFFVIGGAILLLSSDLGAGDPPDWAFYSFIAVFPGGTLIAWAAFNLLLLRVRGQTAGMYVIGIRAAGEDRRPLTGRQTLLRWFGLHPLFFHPLLLPVWAAVSLVAVSLTLSQIVVVVTILLMLLCVVSPVAGLIVMSFDPQRRALHDRLAGTVVTHMDLP